MCVFSCVLFKRLYVALSDTSSLVNHVSPIGQEVGHEKGLGACPVLSTFGQPVG